MIDSADQRGERLLLPFEPEWNNPAKRQIWESIEQYIQGRATKIMARKCTLSFIPPKTANEFLDENHVQGRTHNLKHALGLTAPNQQLVSLLTLGNPVNKNFDLELTRFCNLAGVTVVGGASRLWQHVKSMYRDTRVITYSDRRYASGNLYGTVLGFSKIHDILPSYWYLGPVGDRLYNKRNFRHTTSFKRAAIRPTTLPGMKPDTYFKYDPSMKECDNMFANGYRRMWDAGYISWEQLIC